MSGRFCQPDGRAHYRTIVVSMCVGKAKTGAGSQSLVHHCHWPAVGLVIGQNDIHQTTEKVMITEALVLARAGGPRV